MGLKSSLKYAFHVMVRPFDGFWDLKHEKKGSLPAAIVILAAMLLVEALTYRYSGFIVYIINWEYFNVITALISTLIPFLLWCVSNWCFTTLMDGKGTFKDIFIASCYAMAPYVLLSAIMIVVSNIITVDEISMYGILYYLAQIWCVFLMLAAMMETHEYSLSKAVFSSFLTIVGIGIMIFLFMIFFSLISDAAAYFISLYKEIAYRLY